jgi:multidrug efflux pump subunit AcrA (membrane-fusion protein)
VNNKLEQRTVKLGEERGTDVEIIDGLSSGDAVVVNGPQDMRDGQRAEVK